MNIEIGDTVRGTFTYAEAVMNCFLLELNGRRGWRLPTEREYVENNTIWGWHQNDERQDDPTLLSFTPVRDINKEIYD